MSPSEITPDDFKALAVTIFGDAWADELCIRLGVQRRTVLRWASGERTIPPAVHAILNFWRAGLIGRQS